MSRINVLRVKTLGCLEWLAGGGEFVRAYAHLAVGLGPLGQRAICLSAGIRVEHVGQDVLSVFEPLDHLDIATFHCAVERVSASLTLLVYIGHDFRFGAQHDLGVILEVHLDDFI